MPIVTLSDLKAKEETNSFPVPNQWKTTSNPRASTAPSSYHVGNSGEQPQFVVEQKQQVVANEVDGVFWSWNLDEQPQWYHHILLCICPCLVGPICSDVRKRDYKRLLWCFLLWISVVQIIYFIVELGIGGFAKPRDNPSLGPPTGTLLKLGGKYAPYVKYKYHIHRLFIPIIMHAGFIHIIMNLSLQLLVCLGWERKWGIFRTIAIYVASGVAGNLLSCCCIPANVSVGASGALMGMIGARVSDIICRFYKMNNQNRVQSVVSILMFVVFGFIMSFTGPTIDWAAHLGGVIIGFFLGFAFFCNELPNKWWMAASAAFGLVFSTIFFVLCSLMLALVVKVPRV